MGTENKHRICPVERAGALDFNIRKWLHNPRRILQPYVKEGMTALDLGCGPGFFTVEMARLVGKTGKVIAADLQEGMLARLKAKIKDSEWADRITLHQCQAERIGLAASCDFILVFYMLHEVPDQVKFLNEIKALLKPQGRILLVEPAFHVSRQEFRDSIGIMKQVGLAVLQEPGIHFSRAVVLGNGGTGK
jgi:ubiquinone/menaquinone biosynthesis C-methylase UbiE